jgi:hypothetical protein
LVWKGRPTGRPFLLDGAAGAAANQDAEVAAAGLAAVTAK